MYTEYRLYTVEKFCQLWRAGITANFHVETHAMALTLTSIIVKLREREGQRVDLERSLKGYL